MLVTIEDLELYLSTTIEGTDTENLYTYLISAVQAKAEAICNRVFEETEYVDKIDGNGQTELLLPQYPVISVSEVTVEDIDGSTTTTYSSDDYSVDDKVGSIYSKSPFPVGRRNVSVSYTAGYNGSESASIATPEDLKMAIMDMIEQAKVTTITNPNLKSEKLGDYSYVNASAIEVTDSQSMILKLYTKWD